MNFHRNKKDKLDLNLTPMIDVVFLLLIFFMVTTTFNRETALKIKLPEAEGVEAKQQPKAINLIIDADGVYYLADEDGLPRQLVNQDKAGLRNELSKLAHVSRDVPFVISADAKTPHKSVVMLLDVAGQIGFKHITFAAIKGGGQ